MFHEYLPADYTRPLQLTEVWVLHISDPRETESLLLQVNKKFPTDLPHLRRVHGSLLYLTQVKNCPEVTDLQMDGEISRQSVSLHAPITRAQARLFGEPWPVVWKKGGLQPTERIPDRKYELLSQCIEEDCNMFVNREGEIFRFSNGDCVTGSLSHPVMNAINSLADRFKDNLDIYLCTDFSVFIKCEPCVMCTMALLHSRIAELYFRDERTFYPGISQHGIHWHPKLNHKFRAYRLHEIAEI